MIPLSIRREYSRQGLKYIINLRDEPVFNQALKYKLKFEFGVEYDDWDLEDFDKFNVEDFFSGI